MTKKHIQKMYEILADNPVPILAFIFIAGVVLTTYFGKTHGFWPGVLSAVVFGLLIIAEIVACISYILSDDGPYNDIESQY